LSQVQEVRKAAETTFEDTSLPRQVRVAALITLLPKYPVAKWKPSLQEFLDDAGSRADAVQAMWRSREPVFGSSFGVFLDDPDLKVRIQAIRGAGVMGDKTSIAKLRAAFADEEMRKDALFAYAMAVPSEVSASRMRSLLKRIDEESGGLLPNEAMNVQLALDMRLEAAGKAPIFFPDEEENGHVHGPDCGHVH
jgi:HEAT repeat protein